MWLTSKYCIRILALLLHSILFYIPLLLLCFCYFYSMFLSCAGVNSWIKLQIHLVATIKGLNCS